MFWCDVAILSAISWTQSFVTVEGTIQNIHLRWLVTITCEVHACEECRFWNKMLKDVVFCAINLIKVWKSCAIYCPRSLTWVQLIPMTRQVKTTGDEVRCFGCSFLHAHACPLASTSRCWESSWFLVNHRWFSPAHSTESGLRAAGQVNPSWPTAVTLSGECCSHWSTRICPTS